MSKKSLIIFDIDGTLTNTVGVDDAVFLRTIEDLFGFNLDRVDWSAFEHVTDWGIVNGCFKRFNGRAVSKKERKHFKQEFVRQSFEAYEEDSPPSGRRLSDSDPTTQNIEGRPPDV